MYLEHPVGGALSRARGAIMGDLTQLRREAGRLRSKAGVPISAHVLDGLGEIALRFIIRDARKTLKALRASDSNKAELDALLD